MDLKSVDIDKSPQTDGFTRVTARISRNQLPELSVWFEVENHLRDSISTDSTPWILAMLPYAMEAGENIRSDMPSDASFVDSVRGLVATWRDWYPWLKDMAIECPVTTGAKTDEAARRTGVFFSSGVDSWFSILRHSPHRERSAIAHADDLVSVHGLDIPLDHSDEFERLRLRLHRGAEAVEKELLILRTNLRQKDSLWARGWGWLTHGAGLAAIGHLLDRRLSRVVIGSTHPHGQLIPWGSHPMTDPMMSSRRLRVVHDGASFNRVQKTQLLARHEDVLSLLHVCWKHGSDSNCGRCSKCIRTMATLELLDANAPDGLFENQFDFSNVATNYLSDENEESFMLEVRDLAKSLGKVQALAAIERSIRISRRLRPLMRAAGKMRRWPYVWRLENPIRRSLLRALG